MPTYVVLLRYTQQGISTIKDSPRRLDAAKAAMKAAGGEIKAYYLTMGRCDAVLIAEAPDDTTLAKVLLATAAQGNIQTETLRAFPEAEFRTIIAGLP
jgi:uncharacterized protein with GYD domain